VTTLAFPFATVTEKVFGLLFLGNANVLGAVNEQGTGVGAGVGAGVGYGVGMGVGSGVGTGVGIGDPKGVGVAIGVT